MTQSLNTDGRFNTLFMARQSWFHAVFSPPYSASGQCEPVCAQGCVNGTCMSPGACQCHFGFVGDNCSSQCSCNKHSNCAGVNKPDVCLECHNNTIVRNRRPKHRYQTVGDFFVCQQMIHSLSPVSRESTVRSVSLCLWAPRREVELAVHVGNFAGETAMFVCPEMSTGRLGNIPDSSSWTPAA